MKEDGWDYPLIPPNLDELASNEDFAKTNNLNLSTLVGNAIPRNVWIAFREVPPMEFMPENVKKVMEVAKSENWAVNLMDGDDAEDQFMLTYFAHSAIHWAYKLISPAAAVSKVDIWRYCVLYLFGGFYMDDDSSMSKLDEVNLAIYYL
jgi:mannosyltransferase OCH1-like enzyme